MTRVGLGCVDEKLVEDLEEGYECVQGDGINVADALLPNIAVWGASELLRVEDLPGPNDGFGLVLPAVGVCCCGEASP